MDRRRLPLVVLATLSLACSGRFDAAEGDADAGRDGGGGGDGGTDGGLPSVLVANWRAVVGTEIELVATLDGTDPADLEATLLLENGAELDLTPRGEGEGEGEGEGRFRLDLEVVASAPSRVSAVRLRAEDAEAVLPLPVDPVALRAELDGLARDAAWRDTAVEVVAEAGLRERDLAPRSTPPTPAPLQLALMDTAMLEPLAAPRAAREELLALSVLHGSLEATVRELAVRRELPVSDPPQPPPTNAAVPDALRPLVSAVEAAGAALESIDRSGIETVRGLRGRYETVWFVTEPANSTLLAIHDSLDWGPIVQATLGVARAIDALRANPPDLDGGIEVEIGCGRLVVGSTGSDEHDGGACLVVDPDGDDVYHDAASTTSGPLAVIVDLGGSDTHEDDAGMLGVSIVADLGGTPDRYEGGSIVQGAGVLGVGVLLDDGGDDTYSATDGAQGFGWMGLGVLVDLGGDDRYESTVHGQGSALSGGVGALLDSSGADEYFVGGVYPDLARNDREHTLGLGQGFGCGALPVANFPRGIAGGLGMLVDLEGDDRYEAEVMVQGGGYWLGVGWLLDLSGDDVYQAYNYTQGVGVHIAHGVALDVLGNDERHSSFRSQGVGIDKGVGMAIDDHGDDAYEALEKWSQATGLQVDSFGLLSDGGGDDVYSATEEAQGWIRQRDDTELERPAKSLLLDEGGHDEYGSVGEGPGDGRRWIQNGRGVGADL